MENFTEQPTKPAEKKETQSSVEFDINAFKQMLRTLQQRKEQGHTF
jgi:hypothetical protein